MGSSFLSCESFDHTVRLDPGGKVLLYPGGEVTAEAPIERIIIPPIRRDDIAVVCVAGCGGVGR